MSIENEIKKLTKAIEALTEAVVAHGAAAPVDSPQPAPVATESAPAPEADPEPDPEPETPAEADEGPPSEKDLQKRCMDLVRKDRAHTAAIRAALADMGAETLKDLTPDGRANFDGVLAEIEAAA